MEHEVKAKAKAKANKKAIDENTPPPSERKSIFAGTYPGSVEDDWAYYDGLGWVHRLERYSFRDSCGMCSRTEKWHYLRDLLNTVDGRLHKSIVEAEYVYCKYAEAYVRKDSMVEVRNAEGGKIKVSSWAVDNGRFFKCDFSGDFYPRSSRAPIRNSPKFKYVAVRFVGEHFAKCDHCGNYFEKAAIKHRPDVGMQMCDVCYAKVALKGIIHAHNYDGYPKPITTPKYRMGHKVVDGVVYATGKKEEYREVRLFGWEMETEMHLPGCKRDGLTRHTIAKALISALGKDFVICKEDGTLMMNGKYSGDPALDPNGTGPTYAGFEVVSAPADLETHRNRIPALEKAEGYKHLRAWDTDTCGFHVHVSREALTHLQIARMLIFINHRNNAAFVQKIAGRGSAKFCRYVEKEPKDALKVDPRTDENRRQAINLCNAKTVEFRIFRGTVNPKHILRNIEFCDAVCDFCYPGSRSLKEMFDYKCFIRFVEQNKKKWPLLAAWFAVHNIIKLPKIKKPAKANKERFTLRVDEVPEHEIKTDRPEPKPPKLAHAAAGAGDEDEEGDDF